ncbi:hypothetical protein A8M32_01010 [Sinorhizobium alkalisoli]|uniref:Uncharacterized protein n=1 Tax=Sinorhizobium alkalisoli TaxID=1752398 RepID=A0A1E3VHX6_9HYPH|nr:hypothetical protein A8M32_01010 [Sinorhizobium alkalisoli]
MPALKIQGNSFRVQYTQITWIRSKHSVEYLKRLMFSFLRQQYLGKTDCRINIIRMLLQIV